tara:strand:- start:315 stop:1688 length:1374 start_codon:yes stop_codon:yes gene_type:complete
MNSTCSICPPALTKILEYISRTSLSTLLTAILNKYATNIKVDSKSGPFTGKMTPTTMVVVTREQQLMIDYWMKPDCVLGDHNLLKLLRHALSQMGDQQSMILSICDEGSVNSIEETLNQTNAMMMFQCNLLGQHLMERVLGYQIPCSIQEIPGKGRGLVANRDINPGEVVACYPCDWAVDETHFKEAKPNNGIPETYNFICGDRTKWGNLFCLTFGFGNDNEKRNQANMIKALKENAGITTDTMRCYGLNLDANETGERTCVWGDPTAEHENNWMLAHLANDGIMKKGMTQDQYKQKIKRRPGDRGAEWCPETNITLSLVCRARRPIKKGDEIQTHYGDDYWFSGDHHMSAFYPEDSEEMKSFMEGEKEKNEERAEIINDWKTDAVKTHMDNMDCHATDAMAIDGATLDIVCQGADMWKALELTLLENLDEVGFTLTEENCSIGRHRPLIHFRGNRV